MTTFLCVTAGVVVWYFIAYLVCDDRSDDWLFGMCDPPSARFVVWLVSPLPPVCCIIAAYGAVLGLWALRRGFSQFCQWGGRCLFDRS